ncbi:Cell wall-associated hydrolase, NlpC family [Actinacidiphila alni]|uniref:Cell wall-associated hydrolase, NlpC family n=1 Tax=Actinacidiphila alni TaxID=380248 RepID=A0A1I2DKF6_9ACTN|nr:C40 family peptidase [Actinacidiphila alni]SFE80939.1 Cell wall-associated hydrolase, NlpC family [Actinacidiphila alni]
MASHSPAAHRKTPALPRQTTRAALTVVLASAASVSLLGESAVADPQAPAASVSEVKAQVADLYRQAETATEQYNGAKEEADAARAAVDGLQDELARKTARLNATRDAIGALAAAQYRTGSLDPSVQLALSSTPDTYLERAGMLSRLDAQTTAALARLSAEQRDVTRTHDAADEKLDALSSAQARLAARKKTVQSKLRAAQALLDRLTAAQRAAVEASDGPASAPSAATRASDRTPLDGNGTGSGSTPAPPVAAPSSRAAQAVAFAYRAIGLPYVWGATGPNSYDCSGLTQAAWKSAGVSLPRTTYTQINAGTRVSKSQLQPGDLVFFYSGISHVGLYIGNGQMIHAPHPGAPVRIAPISEMPFAGATRPS